MGMRLPSSVIADGDLEQARPVGGRHDLGVDLDYAGPARHAGSHSVAVLHAVADGLAHGEDYVVPLLERPVVRAEPFSQARASLRRGDQIGGQSQGEPPL